MPHKKALQSNKVPATRFVVADGARYDALNFANIVTNKFSRSQVDEC